MPSIVAHGGEGGSLGRFSLPLLLSSTAPLPCKAPLLLLGIIGLAAALLEFEEGFVAFPVKKFQNITFFTLGTG